MYTRAKMDALKNIMIIIDKNQDNISDGDYLDICNNLKNAFQKPEPKSKWDNIMDTYIEWKQHVRLAMEAEAMIGHVNNLYEHVTTRNEDGSLYNLCLEHHLKKNQMEQPTDADTQYVRENLELVCQDIVDQKYREAYRNCKYEADEKWEELTKYREFEEFLDLLSPVELYMHRALCEPTGETLSCVYRQKEKIVAHEGHYIQKKFKWFSHEREYPHIDEEDE